jgi:hypothetical protein
MRACIAHIKQGKSQNKYGNLLHPDLLKEPDTLTRFAADDIKKPFRGMLQFVAEQVNRRRRIAESEKLETSYGAGFGSVSLFTAANFREES